MKPMRNAWRVVCLLLLVTVLVACQGESNIADRSDEQIVAFLREREVQAPPNYKIEDNIDRIREFIDQVEADPTFMFIPYSYTEMHDFFLDIRRAVNDHHGIEETPSASPAP